MKLFVTGCLGFIGSNFIHYIQQKYPDWTIINYDKVTYAANFHNLNGIDESKYTFIKGDICDYTLLYHSLHKYMPDVIVSFSGETHVDNSLDSAQEFLTTNICGTENLLRCVNELNLKKLIWISTDEVYGSIEAPLETTETHRFEPNSPYSVSKAAGDMLCRSYYVSHKTPVIVIRGSNCIGPRQFPEKFIPTCVIKLLTGDNIPLYGDGLNEREWTFTEDFCSGIEAVLLKGQIGESYNLGSGKNNRVSNKFIANTIIDILGLSQNRISYVEDRKGHDRRYALNSDKLRSLGWQPKYSIKEALEKTIKWYQENEEWYKPLL